MIDLTFEEFYSSKINNLTLNQALELHYKLNPQFTPWNKYDSELLRLTMKSHDICHVVSGNNTSLKGEFFVELWTLFSTNLTIKKYKEIVGSSEINKEPFEIVKKLGYLKVFRVMLFNSWYIPILWLRTKQMKKKWSTLDYETHMNRTISEIRSEYNIIVK